MPRLVCEGGWAVSRMRKAAPRWGPATHVRQASAWQAGRWLVSWQLSRCAAKESGCEILPVADADQGSSPRCSWIGSRAVISNSNSYWSDQAAGPIWERTAWPARIYKQELINL